MTLPPEVVVLTDLPGLLFWPRRGVAMIREELEGRLEVLSADGALAHRPGPLEALEGWPFVRVGAGTLVHPAFAAPDGDRLRLPGGWEIPGCLPTGLPADPPRDQDPVVPGPEVRASEVLYLECHAGGASVWVTDRGRIPGEPGRTGQEQAARHPDLRAAGRSWHVNPRRLRFLRRSARADAHLVGFDDGTVLEIGRLSRQILAGNLGLKHPEWVGGETEGQRELRRLGIRRWPLALNRAPAVLLSQEFAGEPGVLVSNLAMQTVETLRRGEPTTDRDTHRGWYYEPARHSLNRAGHLLVGTAEEPVVDAMVARLQAEFPGHVPASLDPEHLAGLMPLLDHRLRDHRWLTYPRFGPEPPLDAVASWTLTCRVLTALVRHLCTYRDLGFRDLHPEYRMVGPTHPDVVLLVEKEALVEHARALHEHFGVTVFLTGGLPSLIGVEHLAEALARVGVVEVWIVSYCDYDVVGWDMPCMLRDLLARYGLSTREIRRLVMPERFTADELERLAVPVDTSDQPRYVARLRRWLRETGGIGGKPLGMLADYLQPRERLVQVFGEVVGGWVGSPSSRPRSQIRAASASSTFCVP